MTGPFVRSATTTALAAALLACSQRRETPSADARSSAGAAEGVATGVSSSGARFVRNVIGFQGPESVRYDPEQDVFFVSNMAGYGSVKDGNGYVSRVSAADPRRADVLVQGGKAGAQLDAPKGMAIHGDTLWVADIDKLRGFDRRSGAPLATIDFAPQGAVLLNDVAVGPDGAIRVTDTGILMSPYGVIHSGPDRIFSVGPNRAVSVVAEGAQLGRPNGITWDPEGHRWIVVSFDPFAGEVAEMPAAGGARRVLRRGPGKLDGVEVLPSGAILFTSWADSSVHSIESGHDRQLVRAVPEAADIGVDTKRNRLLIPLSSLGRVQLWELGPAGRASSAVAARR